MLPHFAPEEEAISKSRALASAYRRVVQKFGVEFIDAASLVSSAGVDRVHLDQEGHRRLGEGLANWIGEQV